jgi:hypothetical protein
VTVCMVEGVGIDAKYVEVLIRGNTPNDFLNKKGSCKWFFDVM